MSDAERAALAAAVPRRGQSVVQPNVALPGLPSPLFPLVGREREVADVCTLLRRDDVRLVTLTGAGGVGKTRLALQVAADLAGDFAHGAAFVSLSAVRDPAFVASTVAHAFGVVESRARSAADLLADTLRERCQLLVLDNYEHLLDAAPLVTELLAQCPGLEVLVTSRAGLRLDGERVFPVPPLAVPDPERRLIMEQVIEVAAVRLFVDRAQDADPTFTLTDGNAGAVVAICHRLDGLPLAIELAAARSVLFAPDAMLPRLARRLPLLTGGRRDAPDRHRTMRDAIAWSYDLLSPDAQALFRRLAVFVGGFTLGAAEAVVAAPGDPTEAALAGVAALVDHCLLRLEPTAGDAPRWLMLETVREYGLERLAAAGEEAATRARHAAWCLELGERFHDGTRAADYPAWLDRIEAEHGNLRAALAWLDKVGDGEGLLRLAGAVQHFWFERSHRSEGLDWLERARVRGRNTSPGARLRAAAGFCRFLDGCGEYERAAELIEERLTLADEIGDPVEAAWARHWRAVIMVRQERYDEADPLIEEAAAAFRALGDEFGINAGHQLRGRVAYGRGDFVTAIAHAVAALDHRRRIGDRVNLPISLEALALLRCELGDGAAAATLLAEALALRQEAGEQRRLVGWLAAAARLAVCVGQMERAARLYGASEALGDAEGSPLQGLPPGQYRTTVDALRGVLGADAFAAAWAAGRMLPVEHAIGEALEVSGGLNSSGSAAEPAAAACGGKSNCRGGRRRRALNRPNTERKQNRATVDDSFTKRELRQRALKNHDSKE
jgi:predicted ATPase